VNYTCNIFILVNKILLREKRNEEKRIITVNNGYLGSYNDEERSYMR